MNKNKIIEWYCPRCETIVTPKQVVLVTSEGMVPVDVNPKTCPDCNSYLQRHVTRVPH